MEAKGKGPRREAFLALCVQSESTWTTELLDSCTAEAKAWPGTGAPAPP